MTFEIVITGLVLAAIASIFASTLMTGISPLPTSGAVRRVVLDMVPDHVDGIIYELGSGWGGLARALAIQYPENRVRAYEVSPLPWGVSAFRWLYKGPYNLRYRYGNFLKADLSDAALVVVYLTGPIMEKLKPKLEAELPPGALVASNTFALRNWEPIAVQTAPDIHSSPVYLYRVGEKD